MSTTLKGFRLPDRLVQLIKKQAKKEKVSESQIVINALSAQLDSDSISATLQRIEKKISGQ